MLIDNCMWCTTPILNAAIHEKYVQNKHVKIAVTVEHWTRIYVLLFTTFDNLYSSTVTVIIAARESG